MTGIKAFFTFLFLIPIGHILTSIALKFSNTGQAAVILTGLCIAVAIMYITKYITSDAWETFCGLVAGVFLWASLFEMGFRLAVKSFNFDSTKATELTLILIVPLFLYLLFNENIRCTFFVHSRRILRLARQSKDEIHVDRWGARTAVKVFYVMWFGHVALYFAYDAIVFGEQGLFTKFFFAFCFFTGVYLIYRLLKTRETGFALRYAVPTVVIIWSCVETIQRWKKYPDPLAVVDPFLIASMAVALVLLVYVIIRTERRQKQVSAN